MVECGLEHFDRVICRVPVIDDVCDLDRKDHTAFVGRDDRVAHHGSLQVPEPAMRAGAAAAIVELPGFSGFDAFDRIEEHVGFAIGWVNIADAHTDNRSALGKNDPVGCLIGGFPDEIDNFAMLIPHRGEFNACKRKHVKKCSIHERIPPTGAAFLYSSRG